MEDELEDKIFYQTYVSHMKILSKFALGTSGWGLSSWGLTSSTSTSAGNPSAMAYVWRLMRVYLTRPEVLVAGLLICLLMFYLQAVEVWTRGFVGRLQSSITGSRRYGGRIFGAAGNRMDFDSMAAPAQKHSWEVRGGVSAVYSIKGRRPNMEDR